MRKRRTGWIWLFFLVTACGTGVDGSDALSAGDEPAANDSGPTYYGFSLLTYNVAGLPEGISGSKPEIFMPLISPLLNDYDIALVQEDFWYHGELIKDVEHLHQTPPMWEEPALNNMGDGLNRFSNYAFDGFVRTQWVQCHGHLDCSSDCLATKGFSVARTDLGDGALVDIYNLHMEAGGCPEDLVSRTAGVAQLIDYIHANSSDVAVIVAGDFNLREGDPTDLPLIEQLMEEGNLKDACTELDCGDLRIDKVMFRSSDAIELRVDKWEVPEGFVSADGVNLSDHEPVAVEVRWRSLNLSP
jgi:endonuclease/exonuclease/phosphatase family metal-dependent hydrolase